MPKDDESPELYGMNNSSGSSESDVESHDSDSDVPVTLQTLQFIMAEREGEERSRQVSYYVGAITLAE
jgi:hypothetical protein